MVGDTSIELYDPLGRLEDQSVIPPTSRSTIAGERQKAYPHPHDTQKSTSPEHDNVSHPSTTPDSSAHSSVHPH